MRVASSLHHATGAWVWLAFLAHTAWAQGGLVTMQGRNFKVGATDFYPNLVNYSFELTSPDSGVADTSQLFLTPDGAYDKSVSGFFECHDPAQCDAQLFAHLQQVKAMGFNTIRAVGAVNATNVRDSSGQRFFTINVHANDPWEPVYRLFLDYPDFQGAVATKHFQLVRRMLDVCDSAGLKVMLLTGGRVGYEPPDPDDYWRDYTTADAEAYAVYLGRMAEELQGHPALFAYDVWNEPRWGGDATYLQTKQTVCEWTTLMYDSLKHYDPGHLVTLGGAHISELNSWDPMVMKLDFYAPHYYLPIEPFGNYDLDKANDEMRAEMYWLGKTCPMPWMLGETAFSADDDTTDHSVDPNWICLLPDPIFHQMPWMAGNEDQQVAYAFQSMDAVRASKGSGYGWWDFQSNRSNPIFRRDSLGNPIIGQPLDVNGNWVSVLGFGDDVAPWRVKKVADTLDTYVLPPEAHELPPEPYNYRSWLAFESDSMHTWGWVKDQNNVPIADAVVEWGWSYNTRLGEEPAQFPTESAWDRITTFSDGYFQVPKPPFEPGGWQRDGEGKGMLAFHGGIGLNDSLEHYLPGTTFTFNRFGPRAVDTTQYAWIQIGDSIKRQAYDDLVVTDQLVEGDGTTGAVADYSARFNVHVLGEFHAQAGSETHLFTEQFWPNCDSLAQLPVRSVTAPPKMVSTVRTEKRAETLVLRFTDGKSQLGVSPNPTDDYVEITGLKPGIDLVIVDEVGRVCFSAKPASASLRVGTSSYLQGQYKVSQPGVGGKRSVQFQIIR